MTDQSAKKTSKRTVKNPETFRERALKASAANDTPSKRSLIKHGGGRVVRPTGRVFRKLFSLPILRWLRRPLRLLGKLVFPSYFRNSWRELRLVTWPSWRESRRLTFAVLIFAIIFGAVIAGVDYSLDKIFRNVLLK